jgi:hypothetical protein
LPLAKDHGLREAGRLNMAPVLAIEGRGPNPPYKDL